MCRGVSEEAIHSREAEAWTSYRTSEAVARCYVVTCMYMDDRSAIIWYYVGQVKLGTQDRAKKEHPSHTMIKPQKPLTHSNLTRPTRPPNSKTPRMLSFPRAWLCLDTLQY